MKSIQLLKGGIAFIPVHIATLDGIKMPMLRFCVDTGATKTTIPKSILIKELGASDKKIFFKMSEPFCSSTQFNSEAYFLFP